MKVEKKRKKKTHCEQFMPLMNNWNWNIWHKATQWNPVNTKDFTMWLEKLVTFQEPQILDYFNIAANSFMEFQGYQ